MRATVARPTHRARPRPRPDRRVLGGAVLLLVCRLRRCAVGSGAWEPEEMVGILAHRLLGIGTGSWDGGVHRDHRVGPASPTRRSARRSSAPGSRAPARSSRRCCAIRWPTRTSSAPRRVHRSGRSRASSSPTPSARGARGQRLARARDGAGARLRGGTRHGASRDTRSRGAWRDARRDAAARGLRGLVAPGGGRGADHDLVGPRRWRRSSPGSWARWRRSAGIDLAVAAPVIVLTFMVLFAALAQPQPARPRRLSLGAPRP